MTSMLSQGSDPRAVIQATDLGRQNITEESIHSNMSKIISVLMPFRGDNIPHMRNGGTGDIERPPIVSEQRLHNSWVVNGVRLESIHRRHHIGSGIESGKFSRHRCNHLRIQESLILLNIDHCSIGQALHTGGQHCSDQHVHPKPWRRADCPPRQSVRWLNCNPMQSLKRGDPSVQKAFVDDCCRCRAPHA